MLLITNCKMGPLLGLIFFTLLMSAKVDTVQGSVYSTPDTAMRFAQCLIEKMTESQFFTIDDRNSIMEVANVMAQAMTQRYQKHISTKILVVAFVTSMADVIIHEDLAQNTHRKGVYASSLEQCSLSSTGYADIEFIMEALRIVASIEHSKLSQIAGGGEAFDAKLFNPNRNPQQPDSLAVQPSPVQRPGTQENFNPNEKTIFESPSIPFDSHRFVPGSVVNTQSQVQASTNTRLALGSSAGSVVQRGNNRAIFPPSGISQDYGNKHSLVNSQAASAVGGLIVPQLKESSVVVIPPSGNQQFGQSVVFSRNTPLEVSERVLQPSQQENVPKAQGAFPIDSAASFAQAAEKDINAPASPPLERTIHNILANSASFRSTFNFDIPQENAINLARVIVDQSLQEYNLDVVNTALTAVSDEIAKVSFQTPENYALALSNALVSVLRLHNLPIFVNGARIANNFLTNLDHAKQFLAQEGNVKEQPKEYDSGDSVSSEKQVDFDFQSPPLEPEDTEGEIFSEILARYLSKSNEFINLFCSTNEKEEIITICFAVIKSSLNEYGPRVSSLAASIISGALGELSTESMCSNFATTISGIISGILDENGVLGSANAQDISDKMVFNLNEQIKKLDTLESKSKSLSGVTSLVPYNSVPTLQSSFSNNYNDAGITSGNSNQPSAEYMTSMFEGENYRTSSDQFGENYNAQAASYAFSAPPSPIQTSPVEESNVENERVTSPLTTPFTAEITDEEFTNAMTLTEVVTNLPDILSTENSDPSWTSDDVIDQDALATQLLESFESALEAFLDVGIALLDVGNSTDTTLTTNETLVEAQNDNPPTVVAEETARPQKGKGRSRNSSRNDRRRKRKKTTTQDVDTVTPPAIQPEESVQTGGETQNSETKSSNSGQQVEEGKSPDYFSRGDPVHQQTEYEVGPKGMDNPPSYSEDSAGKSDFVQLDPSFQVPGESAASSSSQASEVNSDTNTKTDDSSIVVARSVSQKASETIHYIRSGNFNMNELCARLNELAPIVNIPPLDYCREIPAIDYLLNVLKSTIRITKNI